MKNSNLYIVIFIIGAFIFYARQGSSTARTIDKALDDNICVKVTMDSISYLGEDVYEMKTRVTNISNQKILLAEYRQDFIIQNDGIGKWTTLKHTLSGQEEKESTFLQPEQSKLYSSKVAISPSIPLLYMNNDGEVNVRLEPKAMFTISPDQLLIENGEESAYWLKLRTSEWILREGM